MGCYDWQETRTYRVVHPNRNPCLWEGLAVVSCEGYPMLGPLQRFTSDYIHMIETEGVTINITFVWKGFQDNNIRKRQLAVDRMKVRFSARAPPEFGQLETSTPMLTSPSNESNAPISSSNFGKQFPRRVWLPTSHPFLERHASGDRRGC
jgi:hypothetical protein